MSGISRIHQYIDPTWTHQCIYPVGMGPSMFAHRREKTYIDPALYLQVWMFLQLWMLYAKIFYIGPCLSIKKSPVLVGLGRVYKFLNYKKSCRSGAGQFKKNKSGHGCAMSLVKSVSRYTPIYMPLFIIISQSWKLYI